jgi:SpoVK/Ycf46/Vps4 family AAA+-type ATPase
MDKQRLLMDAFNLYYQKGMEDIQTKRFNGARDNLLRASETLLKLAKASEEPLKKRRLERADELMKLAERVSQLSIQSKHEQQSSTSVSRDLQRFNDGSNQSSDKTDEDLSKFVPSKNTGITLDDVAGLERAKTEVRRRVIDPQKFPHLFSRYKKKTGGGILLYGAPGTGKTMFAQAIATELNAAFFSIKASDIGSKWFGDSEKNIRLLFEEARKHKTAVIFFDEFEALGAKRDSYSTVMKRLVPELLSQIQGFERYDNTLLIVAATNRPWDIDPAFLRPGRFNTQIYIPLPDEQARAYIIEKQLDGIPKQDQLNTQRIVSLTDGFNGSDVVEFCEKLKDLAIERSIETGQESKVQDSDIDLVAEEVHSSVQVSDLQKIAKYEQASAKSRKR